MVATPSGSSATRWVAPLDTSSDFVALSIKFERQGDSEKDGKVIKKIMMIVIIIIIITIRVLKDDTVEIITKFSQNSQKLHIF